MILCLPIILVPSALGACTSAPDELEEPKYRLRHLAELGPCASVRCYLEGLGKPWMCSVALEVADEVVVVAEAVSAE